MTLEASDLEVARAIEKLGYCIITLDDWTAVVAAEMSSPVPNPDATVPQAIARLRDAEVLDIVEWRVCRIGGIWLRLNKGEMPPSHIQEGPRPAYAYVLDVEQLTRAIKQQGHAKKRRLYRRLVKG